MQQINQDSQGHIKLGPGALYGAIKTLREEGFIEEMPFDDTHERRRYYRITRKGWNRLSSDLAYVKHLNRLIPGRRPFAE
jgi:DNA-binding PadR family transcriptional regulator